MSGYTAGSVSAEIKLDTKKFKSAIEEVKKEVETLKTSFNGVSIGSVIDDVEKLKSAFAALKNADEPIEDTSKQTKDLTDKLKTAKQQAENLAKALKSVETPTKTIQSSLDGFMNVSNNIDKTTKSVANLNRELKKVVKAPVVNDNALTYLPRRTFNAQTGKSTAEEVEDYLKLGTAIDNLNKKASTRLEAEKTEASLMKVISELLTQLVMKLNQEAEALEHANRKGRVLNKEFEYLNNNFKVTEKTLTAFRTTFDSFDRVFMEFHGYLGKSSIYHEKFNQALSTSDNALARSKERLAEYAAQIKATFETMQVELAKAKAAQYKYWKQIRGQSSRQQIVSQIGKGENAQEIVWDTTSFNKQPLQIQGYNEYLLKINEIIAKLTELGKNIHFVDDSVAYSVDNFTKASEGLSLLTQQIDKANAVISKNKQTSSQLGGELNRLKTQLTTLSGASEKNRKAFAQTNRQAQILSNKYKILNTNLKRGKITNDEYNVSINKLEKELSELHTKVQLITRDLQQESTQLNRSSTILKQNATNARLAGRGLTSFNNGVVQTAHSGRILSNTLYQIRGALLSLKMIFTAMGGMAIWGFAMQVAEEVKTTVTAKNEMIAQLNQNSNVDASGIQYFTKSLDDLTKTYKKVNKYSIGETVSSVGLEFDLTAEQMKKALPIVTMVQSEYVRAGRTSEEAALAVKDILQGEFQRLSRETGVGKEELIEYGWNGKKEDIDSLLNAVKKAGEARHWNVFAKKATSLNDVLTITQSRFSETGADIMESATPMIVEGFNTLIGAIEGVQSAFNNLNPFWQNFALWGGGSAIVGGLLTVLPMVTKGMGLVDIATIGWSKSLATAALNLNKAEVAQYGFRKALAAVISGTTASELATTRSTKAIMGRVLGLNQSILAERGYRSAIFNRTVALKNGLDVNKAHINLGKASILNLETMTTKEITRTQKLAYMTRNITLNEAAELSRGQAILKTATSYKVLGTAILGVMSIGIISWFASLGMQADLVKKRIEAFNTILSSGNEKLKEAKEDLQTYTDQMAKYEKGTAKYNRAAANKEIVKGRKDDLAMANKLVKAYKKQNEEREKEITLTQTKFRKNMLLKAGNDPSAATEKASGWTDKINEAQYEITRSYNEQYNWLYKSTQHINEHVAGMKAEGVELEKRNKYIGEYMTVAEEAGEHLKQFYQGDLQALAYFAYDNLKLVWIDLWNDSHFINFWKSVQKVWEDIKPYLYALKDGLVGIAHTLMDFFSTEIGQTTMKIGLFGAAIGLVVGKIGKWVTGSKSTISALKDIGSSLVNRIREWRLYNKEKSKAEAPTTTTPSTTTGGTVPDKKGASWIETTGKQLKSDATKYARAGVAILAGMALITEAIILMKAPMWALAEVGEDFKVQEPKIRSGIEGLKLIAPVMMVLLPPIVALTQTLGKYDKFFSADTLKGVVATALGIAVGMGLVAETIVMIAPSLWAMAYLGDEYTNLEPKVKKGTEAMKAVTDSLNYLAPFIPAMVAAIAIVAAAFVNPLAASVIGVGITLGIPIGMLWIAETIWSLEYPLNQIAALGNKFDNLDGVKQGAETIKIVSEAMGHVQDALNTMVNIEWTLISDAIAKLIGVKIGADFTTLSEEGGFFDQLNEFVKGFNTVTIEAIDTNKVTTMSNSATGIESVKNALNTVKDSLKDLPNFEVDNRSPNEKYQDAVGGQGATTGVSNYFEQLKEPITQLNSFIKKFNELEIEEADPDKVSVIQTSANAIGTINSAIENVKTAVGNGVDAQWNANVQSSGILGAGINLLVGNMGQSSSIKAGLDELLACVTDIMNFNSEIAGLTSEGSGNTSSIEGASNMVSALQTQINSLKTTLSSAVPTVKTTATGMGTAIVEGFRSGLKNLGSSITKKIDEVGPTVESKAESLGKDRIYPRFKSGIDKMSESMGWELYYVGQAIDNKKEELGTKAYNLGVHMSDRFKEGNDMHSPGIMARSMQDEMTYIGNALSINNLPQMAYNLANSLSNNFNLDFNLSNIQLPNITQFTDKLNVIPSTVNNVKTQVSTGFNAMKTNIGGSFTNILTNTKSSMTGMLSATTKNIGAIRTSWRGMQTALIASAENIRKQTGDKINNLKSNMATFWKKIQNPSTLISAGGHTGSIRRRGSTRIKGLSAGGDSSPSLKGDSKFLQEYLKCLATGNNCYAGGWNFNWNKPIHSSLNGWNTNFGKYHIDDHVKVGKFYNNNFPVKGVAEIAKAYIWDTISGTDYSKYFNSKFGGDPVSALRAGAFNCWDGANVILAIARAFGFEGHMEHGTWNGIGHMWANVPGLGIMDATAIQNLGRWKSPSVKGYSAGSIRRTSGSDDLPLGDTYGDINITIYNEGENVTVNERNIDRTTGKKIYELLGVNPATGR